MSYTDTFRMSVHAIITDNANKVLMLKATYNNLAWGLPGGALEPGETVHQALLRECKEELGCDIEIQYLSGIYYHRKYNSHAPIFRCILLGGPIKLSSEHSEYGYLDVSAMTASQRQRVEDCLSFDGRVKSAVFE